MRRPRPRRGQLVLTRPSRRIAGVLAAAIATAGAVVPLSLSSGAPGCASRAELHVEADMGARQTEGARRTSGVPREYVGVPCATSAAAIGSQWLGASAPASPTSSPALSNSPSAVPTPTAGGGTAGYQHEPSQFPRAGCQAFADPVGDAGPALSAPAAFSNDPDLDIVSVAVKTTTTQIEAMVKVALLGDLPAKPMDGDQFQFEFSLNGKTFNFAVGRSDQIASAAGVITDRGQVNGATDSRLKVFPTFAKAQSTVVLAIDRAGLEAVAGSAAPVGTTLSAVKAMTKAILGNRTLDADTAQSDEALDQAYVLGDNLCFFPPAALMEWLGDDTVTSHYGDPVEAAVALSSEAGDALVGADVIFTLGAARVAAITDSDGVADVYLPALAVGLTRVMTYFPGNQDNYMVLLAYPAKVSPEVTTLTLSVSPVGATRVITGTLLDDDLPSATALPGRPVTVFVNGKKTAILKTNTNGKAVYRSARAGQTIKFTVAGVPGKYLAASAQQAVT